MNEAVMNFIYKYVSCRWVMHLLTAGNFWVCSQMLPNCF